MQRIFQITKIEHAIYYKQMFEFVWDLLLL